MTATVEQEKITAEQSKEHKLLEYFKGTNGFRLLIAFWPKGELGSAQV